MSKPFRDTVKMVITLEMEMTPDALKSLRHYYGRRGKATKEEVKDYILMATTAAFEDLMSDYANRSRKR